MADQSASAPCLPDTPAHGSRTIRILAASDVHQFQAHLLRLESGCRRSRFGNAASDSFVRAYAARTDHGNTVVAGCFVDGQMRGAAELRSLDAKWCPTAEAAFSVEKHWQGQGIGTALMRHVITMARERAVEHVYLNCHAFNRKMQRMAERVAAKLEFEDGECFADIEVRREEMAPARDASGQGVTVMHV
jgi:GNAT superfamily N-acetyltransferase